MPNANIKTIGQGISQVQNAGTTLGVTPATLNFTGAGVSSAIDGTDPAKINVTITGGGGGGFVTGDIPANPILSDAGTASAGSALTVTLSDAQNVVATAAPSTNVLSDASTATQGTSTSVLRADARLLVTTAIPVATGAALAIGTSTAVSRADHVHTVTYGTTGTTACVGNDTRVVNAVQNTRQVLAGTGLTGGGALSADQTLVVAYGTSGTTATVGNDSRVVNAVQGTRQVIAGTGLTGGGDLTADRTLTVAYGSTGTTACVGNDSRLSDSRAPTGSAGGDLGSTYPNPTVVNLHFGSDTRGDLAVRGASAWGRLAVGAAGQVFVGGTDPSWSNTISGATTFSAASLALTVTNNASVGGTLNVTGLTTLAALTQTGGALSLTGNAASSVTTSSGALTLTSAAAATWSTAAGALTITSAAATTWSTSAGALTINGTTGVNLQYGGVTAFALGANGFTITQPAVTGPASPSAWSLTGGAHTALTAAEFTDVLVNLSGTAQITSGSTIALMRAYRIQGRTYSATAATQTVTNASTLAISIPIAGTNVTLTNRYALNLESGNFLLGSTSAKVDFTNGGIFTSVTSGSSSTFVFNTNLTASSAGVDYTFTSNSVRTAGNLFSIQNNLTTRMGFAYHGGQTLTQGIATTGTAQMLVLTGGAHTGQTLSTEILFLDVNQGTVTWATGALATQRNYLFRAPTLAFAGTSTVTTTATVAIDNQPQVGTNATLTNAYALWVQAGAVRFDGTTIGFLGAAPVVRQTATQLTNNVTSGGSANTIADFAGTVYATDAATIRNDIYQLGQSYIALNTAMRNLGLIT